MIEASVTDTNNESQRINLYLRREKDFDQYIFIDKSIDNTYIYKYSMDEQMKFYMYNKPYNKKKVSLLNSDNKLIEVKLENRILKDIKISKQILVKTYKKYDDEVANVLRNKLYHFFGNI